MSNNIPIYQDPGGLAHPDNPSSPHYWKNIIPSNYDISDRDGVVKDGTNIVFVNDASPQNFNLGSNEFGWNYYYPVLPKLNRFGDFDESNLGLQKEEFTLNEGTLIFSNQKKPFICGKNGYNFVNQCTSKFNSNNHIYFNADDGQHQYVNQNNLKFNVGIDYRLNNIDKSCSVALSNNYYNGIINLDFSDIEEDEVINCIYSDCIGIITGDYYVNFYADYDTNSFLIEDGKGSIPFKPTISNKDDGVDFSG
jgi:hypothetical protein